MDLRELEYFIAVAGHQSFGRAAAALGIAQPAITRQMTSRMTLSVPSIRLIEMMQSATSRKVDRNVVLCHDFGCLQLR